MIFLDWETYYNSKTKYSLRSKGVTLESYIRDQQFAFVSVSVAVDDRPPRCFFADTPEWPSVIAFLRSAATSHPFASHNGMFDFAILAWRLGIHPKLMVDTLGMARAAGHKKASLKTLAEYYGLPPKGDALDKFMNGTHVEDMSPAMRAEFAQYNNQDTWLCREIYTRLKPNAPLKEFLVQHLTLEMFTKPVMEVDADLCQGIYDTAEHERTTTLSDLGTTLADLRSAPKFAALLTALGVTPPMKPSPSDPEKLTYAFAKTDQELLALRDHDDPRVVALVDAKLGNQSSLRQSRAQRFIGIAQRSVAFTGRPLLPIPLAYCGAENTFRFSGTDDVNMQNLPRGKGLRSAVVPPPDHDLVVVDFSSIEARVLAWLAGEEGVLAVFRAGECVYAYTASNIYGTKIVKGMPERNVGKVIVLGLGYNMGSPKFASEVFKGLMGLPSIRFTPVDADRLGVDVGTFSADPYKQRRQRDHVVRSGFFYPVDAEAVQTHCAVADHLVTAWRASSPNIVKYWSTCDLMLKYMLNGVEADFGPLRTEKDAIRLPNGLRLAYTKLRQEGRSYAYWNGKSWLGIYGGKLAENITQALSRIIMTDAMLLVDRELRGVSRIALTVHDELIQVAHKDQAQAVFDRTLAIMSTGRDWYRDIPLGAEGKIAANYAEAK